jgi:hypothetical protein
VDVVQLSLPRKTFEFFLLKVQDATNKELFFCSTYINIGDGKILLSRKEDEKPSGRFLGLIVMSY